MAAETQIATIKEKLLAEAALYEMDAEVSVEYPSG
jgi:hypothetical protein